MGTWNDSKLNGPQREQIAEWLALGFSDTEIVKTIKRERDSVVTYEGAYWPELTRQAIQYYRNKYSDRFTELANESFEIGAQTGLAKRSVLVRRASKRAGAMDLIIDRIEEEVERLADIGVLQGLELPTFDDDSGVIEADFSKDGLSSAKLPALLVRMSTSPDKDPRWSRMMDLLMVLAKHYASHVKYLELIAKLGGNFSFRNTENVSNQPSITRRRSLEELLKDVGVPVPR